MFKVINANTSAMLILFKVTIKTSDLPKRSRPGVFIVNLKPVLHTVMVFPF